ncbi:hypothetical protein Glove_36g27 [Diversispora epigaea]|uniref:Uncharacterized protein n=1 Tax=Diversispora epigaea TaxID=1348612 RepID=A0A397JH78_9GLOM|nr:hypothetical protein Glove_36g27 [Diversispora epigaea]
MKFPNYNNAQKHSKKAHKIEVKLELIHIKKQFYRSTHDPISLRATKCKKKENWDTKSQMSIASAHIKRLLPYRSCKVYPKAWSEMTRSSARIPNLLPYHSYRFKQIGRSISNIDNKDICGSISSEDICKNGDDGLNAPSHNGRTGKKKENWDTKSQMSIASAHIKRLLPYRSCKVYPKAWSEMTRSSALKLQLTYNPPNNNSPSSTFPNKPPNNFKPLTFQPTTTPLIPLRPLQLIVASPFCYTFRDQCCGSYPKPSLLVFLPRTKELLFGGKPPRKYLIVDIRPPTQSRPAEPLASERVVLDT